MDSLFFFVVLFCDSQLEILFVFLFGKGLQWVERRAVPAVPGGTPFPKKKQMAAIVHLMLKIKSFYEIEKEIANENK
jgi:hypothetical protein